MVAPHKKKKEEETPPPPPLFPGAIRQPSSAAEAGAIRALLPYMSPEDARALSSFYNLPPRGAATAPIPVGGVPTAVQRYYLSQGRATSAMNAVRAMGARLEPGQRGSPGMTFLTRAISLLGQYGGANAANGMTRQQFTEFNTAVDNLFDLAKGQANVAPFARLASTFLRPSFSAAPLVDSTVRNGRPVFGVANPGMYT